MPRGSAKTPSIARAASWAAKLCALALAAAPGCGEGTVGIAGGAVDSGSNGGGLDSGSDSGLRDSGNTPDATADGGDGGIAAVQQPTADRVYHSSDFGWVDGQEIGDALVGLFEDGTLANGDALVLDHMYRYRVSQQGTLHLPPNFILAGAFHGAGIDFVETRDGQPPILVLHDDDVLYNITFTHSDTPQSGNTERSVSAPEDYYRGTSIRVEGHRVRILNSTFRGYLSRLLLVLNVRGVVLQDSHLDGGYWASDWFDSLNARLENTLFENSQGDGFKGGMIDSQIRGCVFLNNKRDGIDTTGVLRNVTIEDSYFVRLFKGFDIKSGYGPSTTAEDLRRKPNRNIFIRRNTFVGGTGVAAVTLDRGNGSGARWINNKGEADAMLTQRIYIGDSTFEMPSNFACAGKALLLEDVHTVEWDNITLRGCVNEAQIRRNPIASGAVDLNTPTNYGLVGTNVTVEDSASPYRGDAHYRALAGPNRELRWE